MLAAKSFNATSDWRALQRWLGILAEELAARMADDAAAHRRHPKTLVLHYRSEGRAPQT
jgi:impB/mucB/samB family C-terminal domain